MITLVLIFGLSLDTQAQKFGYLNYLEVVGEFPEAKSADSNLGAYQKQLEAQFKAKYDAIQQKVAGYEAKAQNMSPLEVEQATKDIAGDEQELAALDKSLADKLETKRQELFEPIFNKVDAAIKRVAEANNYNYIFNTGTGALLYAELGDDVKSLVKKELGF